jgi:hypothetical protein
MTMVLTGTPSSFKAAARRALSAAAMTVGMVTTTNSVVSRLRNNCFASSKRAWEEHNRPHCGGAAASCQGHTSL